MPQIRAGGRSLPQSGPYTGCRGPRGGGADAGGACSARGAGRGGRRGAAPGAGAAMRGASAQPAESADASMAKTALMPLILSLAGTALGHALADLSPLASLAVAGALLLGYWGLLAVTSRPRTVSTSTRGRALLGVGALVAMALTALATFVANFSLLGLALVLALLVLALVLLRVADTSSA